MLISGLIAALPDTSAVGLIAIVTLSGATSYVVVDWLS